MALDSNHFVDTLYVNVDNEKLSDKEFREFIRNTIGLYMTPGHQKDLDKRMAQRAG